MRDVIDAPGPVRDFAAPVTGQTILLVGAVAAFGRRANALGMRLRRASRSSAESAVAAAGTYRVDYRDPPVVERPASDAPSAT
jgi:hypothetical protein